MTNALADKEISVLVLGLGNVLLGDDGLGAEAVVRVKRNYRVPPGIRLEDGGTLGLSLLGLVAEAKHVLLVDAVLADAPPGTQVRLDGTAVLDAVRDRLSPHQVGVADLLDAARLIDRYPDTVTLLGIVPASIELSVARSRVVGDGLETLVTAIIKEVQHLGHRLERKSEAQRRPVHDLARHFGM